MASRKCNNCKKWVVVNDWEIATQSTTASEVIIGQPYHKSFLTSGVCPNIRTPEAIRVQQKVTAEARQAAIDVRSLILDEASKSPDRGSKIEEQVQEKSKPSSTEKYQDDREDIGTERFIKAENSRMKTIENALSRGQNTIQFNLPFADSNLFKQPNINSRNENAPTVTSILADVTKRLRNIRCDYNGESITLGTNARFPSGEEEPIDEYYASIAQKLILRAIEPLLLEANSGSEAFLFTKLQEIANDLNYQKNIFDENNVTIEVQVNNQSVVRMLVHGNKYGQGMVLKKIQGTDGTYNIPMSLMDEKKSVDPADPAPLPPWECIPDCAPDQQLFAEVTLDVPFPHSMGESDRLALFAKIAAELARITALSWGHQDDLESRTKALTSQIQIKHIYRGSTHVIFAILPPSSSPKTATATATATATSDPARTPGEILKAIKTILLKDNSTQASKLPAGFQYLNHVIIENGICASPDPIYVDLIAQGKKWIKENWSPSHPPHQSFSNLQLHENLFVSKECCCYQRFTKGMKDIYQGKDLPDKLSFGFGKNQFQFGYHGTKSDDIVNLICHDGWDPKFRAGQAYGKGEYFTKAGGESYSIGSFSGGTQKLILAVILGDDKPSHWTSQNPYYVVLNPSSPNAGSPLQELPSYCLPVIVISWGPNAPKFHCPSTCPNAKKDASKAVEIEVEALLIDPSVNKDEFYRVRVLKNGSVKMSYDVVSSTGPTGTIPFGPGSTSTAIGTNIPTYDSAVHLLKKEFTSVTGLNVDTNNSGNNNNNNNNNTDNSFQPGKWFAVPALSTSKAPLPSPPASTGPSTPSPPPPPSPLSPTTTTTTAAPATSPLLVEVMWQYYDKQRLAQLQGGSDHPDQLRDGVGAGLPAAAGLPVPRSGCPRRALCQKRRLQLHGGLQQSSSRSDGQADECRP